MFAIDFDGTIADTNTLKSHRIQEHLGVQIPPHECDKTTCVSKIGIDQYTRISAEVYKDEISLKAFPVPGSLQAISFLRKHGQIYVITARDQEEVPVVSEWLYTHKLDQHIRQIITSGGSSKIQIAKSLNCKVLIDDDIHHLKPDVHHPLLPILLKVGLGEKIDIPPRVTLCTTWRDAMDKAMDFHLHTDLPTGSKLFMTK